MEGYSSMSKKKGEGLKSFNKGFSVPDTYIIIFFVVVLAAIVTFFVPKGYYETQDVTYMMNGVEKTRTVIKDGSFQYLTDDAGNAVTEGIALFSGDGESGFFNYMFNGIVAGVIGVIFHLNDMKVNDIATSFKNGAKDLIGTALVVAMAQGIMQVLGGSDPTTPTVINTIMYGISKALAGLSGAAAAVLMYVFQSVFNFFVVSGSGQAAITMPIMAPLADLLGVSRQTSVLAFQLGDAFTNLIVPTSGCLIGSLAIARIEWSKWIKFMWKFLGVLMIGAVITILIAVGIGF